MIVLTLITIVGFSIAAVAMQGGNGHFPSGENGRVNNVSVKPYDTSSISAPQELKTYQNYFNSSRNKTLSGNPFLGKVPLINKSLNRSSNSTLEYLFLPNYKAASMYKFHNDTVTPLYFQAPAPMGIGDFGIKNVSGALMGYSYNTSSFEGTVSINNLTPLYLLNDAPNSVSIQLNTVLNNVTLFGVSHYVFWTQNVIFYSARTHQLTFIDNIWNFSSPSVYLSSNAIYNSTGEVYPYPGVHIAIGPTFILKEPFTVHLYLNSTVLNNRNVVYFNYSIPKIAKSGTYDRVTFNSTYGVPPTFKTPQADFLVSGKEITPTGYLLYDAEMMIGGPGGGSTTTFYNIHGNMSLEYLNSTTGKYQVVPSAFNYGTDTGETSSGVSIYWNSNDEAFLNTGPSLLEGMWGIQNDPGYISVIGSIKPSNGFIFINPGPITNNLTGQWAPASVSGNFKFLLSPGSYSAQILASDYKPIYNIGFSGGAGSTIALSPVVLVKNTTYGGYTPLFAFGNQQLANISIYGNGTSEFPYIPIPQTYLDPIFGQLNDFDFPVFPGMFLKNTTEYVSTFRESQPLVNYEYIGYDTTPYFFYHVQNVSITGMYISGLLFPSQDGFIAGEVTFWNSSNDMISDSYFNSLVGLAINSSMDITMVNNQFNSSTVWSAYSNTNVANNYFQDGFMEDYFSNDNLVGNVLYQSYEMPFFSSVKLQGNTFYSAEILSMFSAVTGSANQLNYSMLGALNSSLSLSDGNYDYSEIVMLNSTSTLAHSMINETSVEYLLGNNYINGSSIYYSEILSMVSNLSANVDTMSSSYVSAYASNLSLSSGQIMDSLAISEFSNFSISESIAIGMLYESLESNTSIVSSTVSNGPFDIEYGLPFPWLILTFYGTNSVLNDNFITNNYTSGKILYSFLSSKEDLNSIEFEDGINLVNNTIFSTSGGNQASNLIVEYGNNQITNNTFISQNVSLSGNLYGAGSSLIVYGGLNLIYGNKFISINSPATSSFLKYGDASSSGSNQFLYSVDFIELGLPAGTVWTISVNGTTNSTSSSSYTILLSPGTYTYMATSPGYKEITGTFTVVSSSVAVDLAFKAQPRYEVLFTESGLPAGTTWQVTLNGMTKTSSSDNISFYMYNGTFLYSIGEVSGYFAKPSSGSVTVDGTRQVISVTWFTVNYTVSFLATGLATGTSWGIVVNGIAYSSSSNSIAVNFPNGTYTYSVTTVPGYTPASYTGTFTVDGANLSVSVGFKANLYTIEFIESGLPAGTQWSVTLGGKTVSSNNTVIIFTNLSNGLYKYTISDPAGYIYTSSGLLVVSNSGVSVSVPFTKQIAPPSPTMPIVFGIIAGIGAAIGATFAVDYIRKR